MPVGINRNTYQKKGPLGELIVGHPPIFFYHCVKFQDRFSSSKVLREAITFMNRLLILISFSVFICFGVVGCNSDAKDAPRIVEKPEEMDDVVGRQISRLLEESLNKSGRISDTIIIRLDTLIDIYYKNNGYKAVWTHESAFTPLADSLIDFIGRSKYFGLFPNDYHYSTLSAIKNRLVSDTLAHKDALLWAQSDVMLTDAVMLIGRHLKQGRLQKDSITLTRDTVLPPLFYSELMTAIISSKNIEKSFQSLEPKVIGYDSLKIGLKHFLDSIQQFKKYTYIIYPNKDSVQLMAQLKARLEEGGLIDSSFNDQDTLAWKTVMTAYQKRFNLKPTGKINVATAARLNYTPWEQFKTIALNLDKYKHLPDTMPSRYIWVNIPSYYMQVWDADTLVFTSRVVVGKPETRTPLLTSKITDIITYPQWNIPTSIIAKEVIPEARKSTAYFAKHGYMIVNNKGEEIDPASINWFKYTKGIPYKVIQGSGDANALGILKFNFNNKYSVYMHDTNQRYLFANASRSLSHGCVRVQEWQKLAHFIVQGDTVRKSNDLLVNKSQDSLKVWLKRKEKHTLWVRNRMPVFIRYFTAEGKLGKVKFYEDIYGEDKKLRERYFADKSIQ